MKSILSWALALVVFLPVWLWAGKYEPPKPIVTPEELAAAAAEVPVKRLDLTLPEVKDPMESTALSEHFFNKPEEMRYGGVTSTDWRKKWDLFAEALLKNASKNKLDAKGLQKCIAALNYGRNKQTMLGAVSAPPVVPLPPPNATPEQIKAIEIAAAESEKKAEEENARIEIEKDAHPEHYQNEHIAIIPCGAYLAKYAKGDCWIIVCHWEDIIDEKHLAKLTAEDKRICLCMAHIMVWAMDAKTAEVVAYATCD